MLDIKRDILPLKNIMYRLAMRITLNSQEAEDVVQDIIIRLWNKRDELNDIENLEAYALQMTRNLALDRQALKANQTENIDGMDFDSNISIEKKIDHEDKIESIRNVMKDLPEKQRTVMQLRDFEGRNYLEIASIMNITEDQVKVSLFRARQYVKSKLTLFN